MGILKMETKKPKKILICDDYPPMANSLKEGFEYRGYEAAVFTNESSEYILNNIERKIDEEQPDCVIIDGLEGEFLKAAKSAKKAKKDITVIIRSSREERVKKAKENNYPAFLELDEDFKMFDYVRDN
jgi:DNA-binding response OmpR family regulator